MGSNVPTTHLPAIEWYEQHVPVWADSPDKIGLLPTQCTNMNNLTSTAREKYQAALAARAASEAATVELKNAVAAMRVTGSGLITTIKAFAVTSDDPNVYAMAQISPPSPPSQLPPPNVPTDVKATLTSYGALVLTWKASQPGPGTVYRILRQFNGTGSFNLIDTVGEKMFTDTTIPQGTRNVSYQIFARRSGLTSTNAATINLQFGVESSGQTFIAKIAA